MKYKCPVCHKTITNSLSDKSENSKSFPFCSEKCKLIDLGAWLDSEYKIFSELQLQDFEGPQGVSSEGSINNDTE